MTSIFIIVAVFTCVATLVGAVALMFRGDSESAVEDRLSAITSSGGSGRATDIGDSSILNQPLEDIPNKIEGFVGRFLNLRRFIDQAGMEFEPMKFLVAAGVLAVFGTMGWFMFGPVPMLAPIMGLFLFVIPFLYLGFKRGRRIKKFGSQLPEALELISRALRAGHSLPSGFQLVAEQMSDPIGIEFTRCYEEQNFGIPLEEALESMVDRVPNVDLRFFVTAVILQRQTGGDLSEILDKIGRLIRERFQIWGQIQALTGEGRLSGIVLLALPPVLFAVMLRLNYDYIMMLFEDPLGQQMLAVAIVLQVVGALVIRKIINIKV